MAEITTAPATLAQWHDVQSALTGGGDGRSCQCMWPVLPNKDWQTMSVDERERMLHDEIGAGPPPGLVAYADGQAAGWVRVGPRPIQRRIMRSRIVKDGSQEPLEDDGVWAITCFSIRREHRGQGITRALLDAAGDYARRSGARVLEAYPIDTESGRETRSNDLYVGALSTFTSAGFEVVAHPTPSRAVVALRL